MRLNWHFRNSSDERSVLEKQFYEKSTWNPPKACIEIENFISRIQEKFDHWKPPKRIKDNISKEERDLLGKIRTDNDNIYMWEDKGPSFTKMSRNNYHKAGEKELSKPNYFEVTENPTDEVVSKVKQYVTLLFDDGEISEKIMLYLQNCDKKLSKFYHLVKTHKIPTEVEDPTQWMENNGFPVRGIISSCGSPTERLAGFVDFFLQPGMKALPSFLRDTKDTLQTIEQLNEKIQIGDFSLDNINLVSLDVANMYGNMSDELGISACESYLNSRDLLSQDDEFNIKIWKP